MAIFWCMDGPIRLLGVVEEPLSLDQVVAAVSDRRAGGTAFFLGTVRDRDSGRDVVRLDYSAHPTVIDELRRVAEKIVADHPVVSLAAVHRVGELAVGDIAVIVAVACPHRSEAFVACRQFIDDLKHSVPIWKHQCFADGEQEWVGVC